MITDYDCSSWAEHTQTCLSAGSSSKSSGWSGRESCSFIFMIANAVQYISLVFVLLFPLSNLFWVYPPCPVDAVYWTEVVFRHILRISKNCLNLRDLIIFGGFHFRPPMYSEYILKPSIHGWSEVKTMDTCWISKNCLNYPTLVTRININALCLSCSWQLATISIFPLTNHCLAASIDSYFPIF